MANLTAEEQCAYINIEICKGSSSTEIFKIFQNDVGSKPFQKTTVLGELLHLKKEE